MDVKEELSEATVKISTAKIQRTVYCSAVNCRNNRSKSGLKFFHFPSDPDRCKIWVENSRRLDLLSKDASLLRRCYQLCSVHFEDDQFMNYKKVRLNWNAIPTLFDDSVPLRKPVGRPVGSISTKGGVKKWKVYSSMKNAWVDAATTCTQTGFDAPSRPVLLPVPGKPIAPKPSTEMSTISLGKNVAAQVPAGNNNGNVVILLPVNSQIVKNNVPLPQQPGVVGADSRTILLPVSGPPTFAPNVVNNSAKRDAGNENITGKTEGQNHSSISVPSQNLSKNPGILKIIHVPSTNHLAAQAVQKSMSAVRNSPASGTQPKNCVNKIHTISPKNGMTTNKKTSNGTGATLKNTRNSPSCNCSCCDCQETNVVQKRNKELQKQLNMFRMRYKRLKAKCDIAARKTFEITLVQLKYELKQYVSNKDAYEFLLAQLHPPKNRKSQKKVIWGSHIKDMFLSMYRDSPRTYKMFLKVFEMPSKGSLLRHEKELKQLIHLENELAHEDNTFEDCHADDNLISSPAEHFVIGAYEDCTTQDTIDGEIESLVLQHVSEANSQLENTLLSHESVQPSELPIIIYTASHPTEKAISLTDMNPVFAK